MRALSMARPAVLFVLFTVFGCSNGGAPMPDDAKAEHEDDTPTDEQFDPWRANDDSPSTDSEPKRAVAWVRFRHEPSVIFLEEVDLEKVWRHKKSHAQLIRSYFVLSAALAKPSVANLPVIRRVEAAKRDPVDWIGENLDIGFSKDSEVFYISMEGNDAEQVKTLVQAVTDAYLDRVVNHERKARLKRRDLLEQLYYEKREEVRNERNMIYTFERQMDPGSDKETAARQELLSDEKRVLRKDIATLQSRLIEGQRNLRRLQSAAETPSIKAQKQKLSGELELLSKEHAAAVAGFVEASRRVRTRGAGFSAELLQKKDDLKHLMKAVAEVGSELQRLGLELSVEHEPVELLQKARITDSEWDPDND